MKTVQTNLDLGTDKTFQDFRNELQEMSYKELHRMNISGDTSSSNLINRLLTKLDDGYGTEYQQTESIKRLVEEDK